MSSDRTIRRKVSEEKKLFYQEYEKCLKKFLNSSQNVIPEDDTTESVERESISTKKRLKLDNAINVICL